MHVHFKTSTTLLLLLPYCRLLFDKKLIKVYDVMTASEPFDAILTITHTTIKRKRYHQPCLKTNK